MLILSGGNTSPAHLAALSSLNSPEDDNVLPPPCVSARVDRFDGFREFVAAHQASLSRVAYLLAGDAAAAEDLLQSALTEVAVRWRQLSRYERPEAYVRRAMYHASVSIWRRRRRIAEVPTLNLPERAGMDESDGAARRIAVQRALQMLPARQRAVLVLRYFEDMTEEQTAEALGISIGTVKSHTHRALARLRELAPGLREEVTA